MGRESGAPWADVSLSAAAYNAGEGAVARCKGIPPYGTTRAYVRRVNALLRARAFRAPVEVGSANVGALGRLSWTELAPCSPLTLLARPCASRSPNARLYPLGPWRHAVAPPITALEP